MAQEAARRQRWCNLCGKKVTIVGDDPRLSKAVHTATGSETGAPDGHLVAPIDYEPPLWRAARLIQADYGGRFELDARFGILRADWANVPVAHVVEHYSARTEAEMRRKLDEALGRAKLARGLEGAQQ